MCAVCVCCVCVCCVCVVCVCVCVAVLAAILVGDDKASETYVSMKEKTCHRLGLESKSFKLPESSSTEDVLGLIKELNNNANVDGILLQHPVPKQVDEMKCFNEIRLKDVDGVNTQGYGNMAMGIEAFHSCTPFGIMRCCLMLIK